MKRETRGLSSLFHGLGTDTASAKPPAPMPAADERAAFSHAKSNAVLPRIRLLVVDDEQDVRDLLAYTFERSGMDLRLVSSVAEALTELETYMPHVIVSDIGMPLEDGYALIRRIRSSPSGDTSSIPAIALTALARTEDRTRALSEGFNLHMTKPVAPHELIAAVTRLVGSNRH